MPLGIFQVNLPPTCPFFSQLLCATNCQNTIQFFPRGIADLFDSILTSLTHTFQDSKRLLNKRRKSHDKARCIARDFWRDLRSHAVACDESRKAMSTKTIIFHSGRHILSKLCSRQCLTDFFFNLYFRPRPKETAARPDSNIHTDSGFTPSPVGSRTTSPL